MASANLSLETQTISSTRKSRSPLSDAMNQLLNNRAALISGLFIIALILIAIFANQVAPHPYDGFALELANEPPMTRSDDGELFILGTDKLGRDVLSRAIYGARISLGVAFIASIVSLIIGTIYGLVAGYGSHSRDNFMMRIVDFLYGFPFIIAIILIQVVVKAYSNSEEGTSGIWGVLIDLDQAMGGIFIMFVAIGLISWLGMARIVRGQTLATKRKEYIEAARAVGDKDGRIIMRHILPNIIGPCIVAETLAIPGYILLESFLSFIGLGVNPPTPSWGIMISESVRALRTAPWQVFVPSIALTLTVLAFNFLGDGLRDAFDPRLRGE